MLSSNWCIVLTIAAFCAPLNLCSPIESTNELLEPHQGQNIFDALDSSGKAWEKIQSVGNETLGAEEAASNHNFTVLLEDEIHDAKKSWTDLMASQRLATLRNHNSDDDVTRERLAERVAVLRKKILAIRGAASTVTTGTFYPLIIYSTFIVFNFYFSKFMM